MICVLLGASCMIWVFSFSLPQSSLLYTPFERAIHDLEFSRILYVLHLYLLSLIVLLIVLHLYLLSVIIFALVLHLDVLEHGGGFVLKKLLISHASLQLFWESLNSMVIYFELYSYWPHGMCFAWSILYYLCLCLLVYHNHLCCTHILREPYMNWNLLEYSMWFTYIFWAW